MSLLTVHRVLIAVGIAFCGGFAFLEGRNALRGDGSFLLAATFLLLAGGLTIYLTRMRRVLGYEGEGERSDGAGNPSS